jgi:PAS domain S-box-containing protein
VYRYGTDPQSPDKREAVLLGLMYSPIVIAELLSDHGSFDTGEIDYELLDSTAPGTEALLHRVGAPLGRGAQPRMFQDARSFDIGGRTWTVRAGTTQQFEAARAARVPAVIASLGAVISALLAFLVWHLGTRRARAEALAQRATADLALERQRLADILEGANVGTWEMHIATGDCRFDARWAEGLGYTLAELDRATFNASGDLARAGLIASTVHPDDLPAMRAALAAHYAGQTDHFECELRMRHRDGRWLWMQASGRVSQWDAAGRPAMIAGTRMDITDRKAAKAALTEANTVLEERVAKRTAQLQRAVNDLQAFGYSIAHDIRQPLISMGGFTRLLERELPTEPNSRAAHYLDRLRAGVRQIGDLSDGLLTLANLSTAPLNREAVDLSRLARETFEARHTHEPDRPAQAQIPDGLTAHGDEAQLRRLMAILMDNAFKFSRDKGRVDITVTAETDARGQEVFHVSDRGSGFDMVHAGRLFEPFWRAHGQHEYAGLGIGLASAHRIVSRHNGRIWADAAPGEGARFSFTLGTPGGSSSQIVL